jgi:hypothetical protein
MRVRAAMLLPVLVMVAAQSLAAEAGSLPTHCRPGEHIYLNVELGQAGLREKERPPADGGVLLSVCSAQEREPIRGLTVRYGTAGAVSLEHRANPTRRMRMHLERTGPSMAVQVLSFSVGLRTYCILEGIGLQHGVSFYAMDGDNLISFGESGEYQRGSMEIDFHRRSSPVFVKQRPSCNL